MTLVCSVWVHFASVVSRPFGTAFVFTLVTALCYTPTCRTDDDRFGVQMLEATIDGGREWFAEWNTTRTVRQSSFDPADPLFRNSEGVLRIGGGIARVTAGQTRLMIMTPKDEAGNYTLPQWQNVEMTIYARRGTRTKEPSYQAFDLSARSREEHNDKAPCDGTSYHGTFRFDGDVGFKKEIWHTGGYTQLRPDPTPRPWPTVPEGQWIGMKHVVRNCDENQHVRLQLYLDETATNDWKLAATYTDVGGWRGGEQNQNCERAIDHIILEARPTVYFRTDYVNAELRQFSVREIAPLP